jgi:hypothetical protein
MSEAGPSTRRAVVGATAAELGVGPGDRVLDLAAGTGKLTRALVAYGFEVVAVEPQESLRAVLADKVAAARVRDGVAEQIPLEDGSVAAVMIADAFHWFDRPCALGEIRRVLALGAGLALLNTVTVSSTTRCTSSPSPAPSATRPPGSTSREKKPKPPRAPFVPSSATSRGTSIGCSQSRRPTSSQPPSRSSSLSGRHQGSLRVHVHNEKPNEATHRPTSWPASARPAHRRDQLIVRALSGPLPIGVNTHRRAGTPDIGWIDHVN